ncbi:MAG: type II toxin-antitoxin system RelE/ParE family toxin [Elusimicrobia bacterium]|nr:type II toxin-antitoxin system RelE/ParE family toxin [Elusimicrobiota bacterium]
MFSLLYHPLIARDIISINRDIRQRLAKAIQERLSSHPESYGKPLSGDLAGYWTLRVGDYRVVYRVVKHEVWIFAIINRRDVYSEVMNRLSWGASAQA